MDSHTFVEKLIIDSPNIEASPSIKSSLGGKKFKKAYMADIYHRFGGKRFNSDSEDSDQEKMEVKSIKTKEERELYLKGLEDKEAIVSDMGTFFSIFKGIVAVGILFLPYGFSLGGFLFSIIVMLICCLLVYMGYIRLIETKIVLNGDYSEMAEKAFGKIARILVDILLIIGQMGAVTAYLVYISIYFHI